jgi:pyruvate/2-oxoglutarate dehydrogenase complex dihydrolipoamide acyltransferase (E2) component
MRQFNLPDLGEGLEEAEIVAWYVNEGDNIVADQPLVSVETDKAVVEVPSPQSGRIARLFGGKGDVVKVGAPLVEFAEGQQEDSGTVVGEIDRGEKSVAARATLISTWCRQPALAVPLHERTWNARPRAWWMPVLPSPCGACGAPWRNV